MGQDWKQWITTWRGHFIKSLCWSRVLLETISVKVITRRYVLPFSFSSKVKCSDMIFPPSLPLSKQKTSCGNIQVSCVNLFSTTNANWNFSEWGVLVCQWALRYKCILWPLQLYVSGNAAKSPLNVATIKLNASRWRVFQSLINSWHILLSVSVCLWRVSWCHRLLVTAVSQSTITQPQSYSHEQSYKYSLKKIRWNLTSYPACQRAIRFQWHLKGSMWA